MRFFSSATVLGPVVLLGIVLVGLLDWVTGPELSFSIFYLLPIYLAAWYSGATAGLAASALAALTWLVAELLSAPARQVSWVPFWNMGVRLGFFLLTTWLVVMLRENIRKRRFMERLFFHDLLNLTGSLRGFAELLQDDAVGDRAEVASLLQVAADRIIDEIETQQSLAAAESGELQIERDVIQSRVMLEVLVAIYARHTCAQDKRLVLDDEIAEVLFYSDQALLTRILGNLVKNALEATPRGGMVRAGCETNGSSLRFWVNNPGEIPSGSKGKLFRKRFSSKGSGRGLGTQSIRLLVEALDGEVEVSSSSTGGTTFRIRLPLSQPVAGD